MVTHGITWITWRNPRYFKPLISLLILVDHNGVGRSEKPVFSSNCDNLLSVISKWFHHAKVRSGRVAFNRFIEVINWSVWVVGWMCWIWNGIYKSSLAQPSKIIIIFHAEIIEVSVGNLHLVITNKVIILGYIFKNTVKDQMRLKWPNESYFNYLVHVL